MIHPLNIRIETSPNCNERQNGAKPSLLIFHYTGTRDGAEAAAHYLNDCPDHAAGPVSPHYMVDIDGAVTQFVDEGLRAWQAGVSFWAGIDDINSHSIGIELVNPGHGLDPSASYPAFTPPQIESLKILSRGIIERHGILPRHVLGHSDIAPARKIDPGENFPWPQMAAAGIGIWPTVTAEDRAAANGMVGDRGMISRLLAAFGYDPRPNTATLLAAFQRHFHPEIYADPSGPIGHPDIETLARLEALIRQT